MQSQKLLFCETHLTEEHVICLRKCIYLVLKHEYINSVSQWFSSYTASLLR